MLKCKEDGKNKLSLNVDPNLLSVYRCPSRPALILHLSFALRLTAQHIPLNCTAAHCIATLPLSTSTQLYHSPLHCYPPTQHIPLNSTAAHCTVAAVWLTLFHITYPSCLSLPADCHLPFSGHSFRYSSVPLTVSGHEPAAQYVLHVTLVRIFIQPRLIKTTVLYLSFGSQHFLRFPNKLL